MSRFWMLLVVAVVCLSVSAARAAEKEKKKGGGGDGKPSFEAAFKQMDKDKDDKLTKAEFTDGREEPILAAQHFDEADKDKDTFLTLGEFKAGGNKMIPKPRGAKKKANKKK